MNQMKSNSSLRYSFLLLVGDFLALIGAFSLAYVLRVKIDDRPLLEQISAGTFFTVFAILLIFWLLIFGLLGLYNARIYENRFAEAGRLLIGSFLGILFLIGCEYVLNERIFPARLVMLYGFVIGFLAALLFRTIARAVRRFMFGLGVGRSNVLLVGATPITRELVSSLSNPSSGFHVVGVVGDRRLHYEDAESVKVFKSFQEATKELRHIPVHSIIQTQLYSDTAQNDEVLSYAQQNHISYRFVPGNSELFVGKLDVDLFQNVPVIAVHQTALIGWGRVVKRVFDLFISVVGLIVFSPLMVLIYLLLLISGGKSIYKRKRLTRFGSSFNIYKFRSLKRAYNGLDPEAGFSKMGKPELAKQFRQNGDYLEKDPRISFLGRLLRATSLDELPQLFNVVKGDISLVGPRALISEELDKYQHKNLILSVKSGLTGLAVISGRKDIPFEERRKLDLYYVQNWSFWFDVTILLKTVVVVLRRGAR